MKEFVLAIIRVYQATVSPYLTGTCRHYPSCSHYAHEAVLKYGVMGGIRMTLGRLVRCRPFGSYGYDPVL